MKRAVSISLGSSSRNKAVEGELLGDKIRIERIGTDRAYSLIHADLHPHNCILYEGRLGVIDFSDCRFASHFYDMAVPLKYLDERRDYRGLWAALYRGYRRIRPLPDQAESAVQVFMVARAFDLIEWIHFDWPSPTHHPWGPALLVNALQRIRQYMSAATVAT